MIHTPTPFATTTYECTIDQELVDTTAVHRHPADSLTRW